MSHTPRLWRAGPSLGQIIDEDGRTVCDVYHDDDDLAHTDTLLLAASPDLLAACELLLEAQALADAGRAEGFGFYVDAVEAARTAVKKARGTDVEKD